MGGEGRFEVERQSVVLVSAIYEIANLGQVSCEEEFHWLRGRGGCWRVVIVIIIAIVILFALLGSGNLQSVDASDNIYGAHLVWGGAADFNGEKQAVVIRGGIGSEAEPNSHPLVHAGCSNCVDL